MTKKYKTLAVIFTILSVLCFIGPVGYFIVAGFISSTLVVEKVALSLTVVIVIILSLVALINKCALRSRIWILLIGLYICLDNIMIPLIIIAVCQVLDELVLSPLAKHFRSKFSINKEIDKRL